MHGFDVFQHHKQRGGGRCYAKCIKENRKLCKLSEGVRTLSVTILVLNNSKRCLNDSTLVDVLLALVVIVVSYFVIF